MSKKALCAPFASIAAVALTALVAADLTRGQRTDATDDRTRAEEAAPDQSRQIVVAQGRCYNGRCY